MEELVLPAGQHEGCAGWGNRSRVAEAARPAKMSRPVASDAPGAPDVGEPPWLHGPATLPLEQEGCMIEGWPGPQGRLARIDAVAARRWAVTARAALAARRSEIDALNVFPVPDGDTGTNLYLTLDTALDAARAEAGTSGSDSLADAAAALARATLLAARGNSGVILSQMVRGLSEVVAEVEVGSAGLDAAAVARALQRASDLAYASVSRPVEGTILSVGAAAARAADQALHQGGGDLYGVVSGALSAA